MRTKRTYWQLAHLMVLLILGISVICLLESEVTRPYTIGFLAVGVIGTFLSTIEKKTKPKTTD